MFLLSAVSPLTKLFFSETSCGLQRRVDGMDRQLGSILEQQAGAVAEKLFGDGYARAIMAQSLQDLAQLLPDEAVYANPSQKEVKHAVLAVCDLCSELCYVKL